MVDEDNRKELNEDLYREDNRQKGKYEIGNNYVLNPDGTVVRATSRNIESRRIQQGELEREIRDN